MPNSRRQACLRYRRRRPADRYQRPARSVSPEPLGQHLISVRSAATRRRAPHRKEPELPRRRAQRTPPPVATTTGCGPSTGVVGVSGQSVRVGPRRRRRQDRVACTRFVTTAAGNTASQAIVRCGVKPWMGLNAADPEQYPRGWSVHVLVDSSLSEPVRRLRWSHVGARRTRSDSAGRR